MVRWRRVECFFVLVFLLAKLKLPVFHAKDEATESAFGFDGRKEFLAVGTAVL